MDKMLQKDLRADSKLVHAMPGVDKSGTLNYKNGHKRLDGACLEQHLMCWCLENVCISMPGGDLVIKLTL